MSESDAEILFGASTSGWVVPSFVFFRRPSLHVHLWPSLAGHRSPVTDGVFFGSNTPRVVAPWDSLKLQVVFQRARVAVGINFERREEEN